MLTPPLALDNSATGTPTNWLRGVALAPAAAGAKPAGAQSLIAAPQQFAFSATGLEPRGGSFVAPGLAAVLAVADEIATLSYQIVSPLGPTIATKTIPVQLHAGEWSTLPGGFIMLPAIPAFDAATQHELGFNVLITTAGGLTDVEGDFGLIQAVGAQIL